MKREERVFVGYMGTEGAKQLDDALDAEVIRLTKGKKVKQYTEKELEEKKKRTDEDYKRIAEMLNRKYKNPERAVSRKANKKEKFGKTIVKRLTLRKK